MLNDKLENWKELDMVCKAITFNAIIGERSAGHIHVGAQVLGDKSESWLNFLMLWSIYENVVYRFLYGEFLNERGSLEQYAVPIARKLRDVYQDVKNYRNARDIVNELAREKKNQAINFGYVGSLRNTIEFRCPNGTLNAIIWQNNVNMVVKMLMYAANSEFNRDVVERRGKLNGGMINFSLYKEVYLEQALEFADLIFNNNFDKVYFLRQYLKSFEVSKSWNLKYARKFTRK